MSELQEVLTGPQAVKYGPLPKVELPADDSLLLRFALEILAIVRNKGIYRRDNVPMLADSTRGRLEVLTAQAFRTWVERHLVCFKRRFDRNGEPYDVLRTMTKETAEGAGYSCGTDLMIPGPRRVRDEFGIHG